MYRVLVVEDQKEQQVALKKILEEYKETMMIDTIHVGMLCRQRRGYLM